MSNHIELTVRGYHLDVFGHVNNARYLEFLEEARWDIFEQSVARLLQHNLVFTVVNININYRKGAVLHDVLTIDAKLSKVGTKSFVIKQEVRLKDSQDLIADAEVTCVVVDSKTQRARLIDDELTQILNPEADQQ